MGFNKFTRLRDTPDSYLGQAGKAAKVKSTEDGLEFGAIEAFVSMEAGEDLILGDAVYISTGALAEELRISQTQGNQATAVADVWHRGQTFTPKKSFTLTKITLKLKRLNNPAENFIVAIKETDANGHPTGDDLATVTKLASEISTSYTDYNFSFNLGLTANKKYPFICRVPEGDGLNLIQAYFQNTDVYPDGNFENSLNSGASWTALDYDFYFKVYGKLLAGKVYKTDASYNDERIHNFIGFAAEDKNAGQFVNIRIDGVQNGFSGLTPYSSYYLSDTAGAVSSSPGTYTKYTGESISTTEVLIKKDRVLGKWETKAIDTVYQALTDGFVVAWYKRDAKRTTPRVSTAVCRGYTDGNDPPTTLRSYNGAHYYGGTTGSLTSGVSFPVRKGDYWKVVGGYSGGQQSTAGVYFIPLA